MDFNTQGTTTGRFQASQPNHSNAPRESAPKHFRVVLEVVVDVEAPGWRDAIAKGNDLITKIGSDIESLVSQHGARVMNIPDVGSADELADKPLDARERGVMRYYVGQPAAFEKRRGQESR